MRDKPSPAVSETPTLHTDPAASLAIQWVERFVNHCFAVGLAPADLALAMMGAGADILTREWDSPRTLAAFDLLADVAAASATNRPGGVA